MKEKVMTFISENRGGISLFVIVLIVVLLSSALASVLTSDRLTRLFLSISCGVLTMMGIDTIGNRVSMRLGESRYPAVLGIIVGGLAVL